MRVLSMVSQKGGAGRSSLSAHLAVAYGELGVDVVIVDLDPQASITRWSDSRTKERPTVVDGFAERLPQMLATAKEAGVDLVIVDTAPHSEKSALAAMRAADLVLMPTRPRIFDLRSIADTIALLDIAECRSKAVILLNAVPPRGRIGDEGFEAAGEYGLEIAPVRLGDREAFAHALTMGLGVTEYEPKSKAANEIWALALFCAKRMQLKIGQ